MVRTPTGAPVRFRLRWSVRVRLHRIQYPQRWRMRAEAAQALLKEIGRMDSIGNWVLKAKPD
jgi:hypothetical protein